MSNIGRAIVKKLAVKFEGNEIMSVDDFDFDVCVVLRSRRNGHRAGIIKDGQSLLYKHFRLAGHSVADMKVQILEKIYHSSENSVNIQLHQRLRELHWIKELGTAAPYGCNDQIKGVGTLSSPSCKHTNVLGIFNKQQR